MIGFIKQLIAVPIRLLAELAGLVAIVDTLPLWSALWKLTHGPQDGCNLLVLVCSKYGIEAARQKAEKMLPRSKSCVLAATIGFLEFRYYQGIEAMNKWVRIAKEGGYKEPEMLLHLELILSNFIEEYDGEAIREQILSRNDLPMLVKFAALISEANTLLEKHLWDEAEKIADRILNIQEQPDARIIKWVTLLVRDDEVEADKQFSKAQGKLADGIFNPLVAQGWLFLGQRREAMEWLYKTRRLGLYIKKSKSQIGVLARSEEFRDFCEERGDR